MLIILMLLSLNATHTAQSSELHQCETDMECAVMYGEEYP